MRPIPIRACEATSAGKTIAQEQVAKTEFKLPAIKEALNGICLMNVSDQIVDKPDKAGQNNTIKISKNSKKIGKMTICNRAGKTVRGNKER